MTDPFQDVDSGGAGFVDLIASGLEKRATDPQMSAMIDVYLARLRWPADALHLDIGSGSGTVTRRMGRLAGSGRVVGLDTSAGLTEAARKLASDQDNVSFEVVDGNTIGFDDASIENVVMHTLLSHVPDPATLIAQAARVLRPGGRLVVCDADYAKLSFGSFDADPLDACARYFSANFVTQPFLIADLNRLVAQARLSIESFTVENRVVTASDGNLVTVVMATNQMAERGKVSRQLADALVHEYQQRASSGSLYAFTPFCTLVAVKPDR